MCVDISIFRSLVKSLWAGLSTANIRNEKHLSSNIYFYRTSLYLIYSKSKMYTRAVHSLRNLYIIMVYRYPPLIPSRIASLAFSFRWLPISCCSRPRRKADTISTLCPVVWNLRPRRCRNRATDKPYERDKLSQFYISKHWRAGH